MPRRLGRKTMHSATAPQRPTVVGAESAAAGASVDITDAALLAALGYTPTTDQFVNDYRVVRVPVAVPGDEAAATISIASVARNGGGTGWTCTFSAAAAASKKVGVRVIGA